MCVIFGTIGTHCFPFFTLLSAVADRTKETSRDSKFVGCAGIAFDVPFASSDREASATVDDRDACDCGQLASSMGGSEVAALRFASAF